MRRLLNIQFKFMLHLIIFVLINIILLGDTSFCLAGTYSYRNLDKDTLAPELNLANGQLQQQILIKELKLKEAHQAELIMQDKNTPSKLNNKDNNRLLGNLNSWIKRKRGDFYLFIILNVNIQFMRKWACRDLVSLNDERVFRLLRVMGLSPDALKNGKYRKRAEIALLDMHSLNPILSEKLGIKKKLFEKVKGDSLQERTRAIELLEKIGITSEEGLNQIIEWLKSDSWYLISKATQHIQKLSKRKIKKLKEKHAVAYLVKAASIESMTEPIFLSITQAMKQLDADDIHLERAAKSAFFNHHNSPGAKKQAAILMAQTATNPKRTLRTLARFGLRDEYLAVRLGAIEAIKNLGMLRGIGHLKKHRNNLEFKTEEKEKDVISRLLDYQRETEHIENAIAELEMPHILGLYDEITREHVVNVYKLAQIVSGILGLSIDDKKMLINAALKHDLGKSIDRYYSTVVIPAKYEPGDIDLEVFRTEHSFESDNIVEEYDIDTSTAEHLIIRNHHRPDILLEDPDFKDLPKLKQEQVIKILEILMILDWLCGRTEISRPPNWFDHIEIKPEDVLREVNRRYEDTLNYSFNIDTESIIKQIFSLKEAKQILSKNMTHDPKLIAYAMKNWTGSLEHYLNIFRCRILSLDESDIKGAKKFLNTLMDPAFEEALLLDADKEGYLRAKEILTEAIDALLNNKSISELIERHLKKIAKKNPQTLFAHVIQSFYGYKLHKNAELIPWRAYFDRSFTLRKGIRVKIKVLDQETAEKYADQIIALQNINHPRSRLRKEELLGNYIYDGKQKRHTPAKWEHSLIAFNQEGEVIGFALNYERSKKAYKECMNAQDSLYLHIVDVDENYQDKGLATLLVVNSIAKFVNTGFKFLKKTDDVFVTIQTRSDNRPMITVLESKIGFEFAGIKFYSQQKIDTIYALALTNEKMKEGKRKGYLPGIIKRQTLEERTLRNKTEHAI